MMQRWTIRAEAVPTLERLDGEALLPTRRVARMAGCTPEYLRQLARRGEFPPPIKVGRRCLWKAAALQAWAGVNPGARGVGQQPAGVS